MERRGLRVSVLVPVRDGRNDLIELLAALDRQTLPLGCFEVIVADDGSINSLADLASADGRVRIIACPRTNAYAALNMAATEAGGEVLAVCDSDCRPEPDWLIKGLAAIGTADLVGGQIRPMIPDRRTHWTLLYVEADLDQRRAVDSRRCLTGNLFVRRELFAWVGGFDGTLASWGDFDFGERCVAAGGEIAFCEDAIVWHPTRDRAVPFLKRIWTSNYAYALREARDGRRPHGMTVRFWLPVLRVVRARRRLGLGLTLNRPRLAARGIQPTVHENLRALAAIYVVIPGVAGFAQVRGWWHGHRRARAK